MRIAFAPALSHAAGGIATFAERAAAPVESVPVAQRTRLFGNGRIEFAGSNSTVGPVVQLGSPEPSPGSIFTSGHPLAGQTSKQAKHFVMRLAVYTRDLTRDD